MGLSIGDGNQPAFSQQGTIDWVQLGDTGVRATVSVLSRISAGNVDPFTITVMQALASQYQLSPLGKTRINESLQSLKCFASIRNLLWFGFGINHVVHILELTDHGVSALALCGSLSEVMSAEMVASILDKLPAIYDAPQHLRPSLSQWEALVVSCDKAISRTNFGLIAEHFMSLHGDEPVGPPQLLLRHAPGAWQFRACGQPSDIATALDMFSKISSNSLKAVELRGDAVCGLLAAFGFWFLGLEVEIRKGSTVPYRSVSAKSHVHIVVEYRLADHQTSSSSFDVQIASKSYHVVNISNILTDHVVDYGNDNHIMSGRMTWDRAVKTAFGAAGEELLGAHYHLSQIFGTAARIFSALAMAEPNNLNIKRPYTQLRSLNTVIAHKENSFGKGFIHFPIDRLP